MNEPAPSVFARGGVLAGRLIRWLTTAQLVLTGAALLLLCIGGWSPLLRSGAIHVATVLAGGLVAAAILGHAVKPSGGPVTSDERRFARNGRPLVSWVIPLITLLFPLVIVLLLVFMIYPPFPAERALLISSLLAPHESEEEKEVPLKRTVQAVLARLPASLPHGWVPGSESAQAIREAVFGVLESGVPSARTEIASVDLPDWVATSVELAVLRVAPRYWKIKGLTYQCPDAASLESIRALVDADGEYYAQPGERIVRFDAPPPAGVSGAGPIPVKASHLSNGTQWLLWVLLNTNRAPQPAYQLSVIEGGVSTLHPLTMPTGNGHAWLLWSEACSGEPSTVASGGVEIPVYPCSRLKLPGNPAEAEWLQTEMVRQIASMQPGDQPPLVATAGAGGMVARRAPASLPGLLVVAASESDADRIDEYLKTTDLEPVPVPTSLKPAESVSSRPGSLRLRARHGVSSRPVSIDRAQFGSPGDDPEGHLYLYATAQWGKFESMTDWVFTYPGLFWGDFESGYRPLGNPARRVLPFWSRVIVEGQKPIIGYVVAVPRRNPSADGWNLGLADRELLWSVLNECGRRLIGDQLLITAGITRIDTEVGRYISVFGSEDLLRISSLRVRRNLIWTLWLLVLYTGILVMGRWQAQPRPASLAV